VQAADAGSFNFKHSTGLGSPRSPEKRSALSFALYQQNHSANGHDGPSERAVWDIVSRFFRRVNWPYVDNLVAGLESERTPDDDYYANHN
jgi:hypothetical protein